MFRDENCQGENCLNWMVLLDAEEIDFPKENIIEWKALRGTKALNSLS